MQIRPLGLNWPWCICSKPTAKWIVNWGRATSSWFARVSGHTCLLHGHGVLAVLVGGRSLLLVPRARCQSMIELLHRPQGLTHVLWVSCLQFFIGDVVGVGKLVEVATHLWVTNLQRGWVGLQVLWGIKEGIPGYLKKNLVYVKCDLLWHGSFMSCKAADVSIEHLINTHPFHSLQRPAPAGEHDSSGQSKDNGYKRWRLCCNSGICDSYYKGFV